MNTVRRVSYVFLCAVPFLCFVVFGARAFRISGVHQALGSESKAFTLNSNLSTMNCFFS